MSHAARVAGVCAVAVVVMATPARAADPVPQAPVTLAPLVVKLSLGLEYRREMGASRCMDEKHFRNEVARRLHRDPFDPDPLAVPGGRMTVVIVRIPQGLELKYGWKIDDDDVASADSRHSGQGCVGMVEWVAKRIVEDIHVMEADAPAAPPSAPAPSPEALPLPLPAALPQPIAVKPEPPPPKRKVEVHGGVDVVFNPVVAPSVSVGFAPSVGVLLREPGVSIDVGLRAMSTVKATKAINGDAFSWVYASGVLAALVHMRFFFVGPVVEVGTLTPHADYASIRSTVAPVFCAIGVQAGVERSFADLFMLHASIEGAYLPVTAQLLDPRNTRRLLWAMPSLSATIAAGVTFHIR